MSARASQNDETEDSKPAARDNVPGPRFDHLPEHIRRRAEEYNDAIRNDPKRIKLENKDAYNKAYPLHVVKTVAEAKALLDGGANVEARDENGDTPLLCAVSDSDPSIVEFLLTRGAKPESENKQGCTALDHAIERFEESGLGYCEVDIDEIEESDETEILEMLLDNGQLGAESLNKGLADAITEHKFIAAAYLIEWGASVTAVDESGRTALHYAVNCLWDTSNLVQLLLDSGANIEAQDQEGYTPLLLSCSNQGNARDILLDRGANVNATTHKGETPLFFAVNNSEVGFQWIDDLLDHDADPNISDNDGVTPLHLAAVGVMKRCIERSDTDTSMLEKFELLLEHGANVSALTNEGQSPLHYVMRHRFQDPVIIFAPVLRDNYSGDIEMAELLLDNGADINLPDNNGQTPIFIAARNGKLTMVRFLLERGVLNALIQLPTENSADRSVDEE